jgi:hypothetical protein
MKSMVIHHIYGMLDLLALNSPTVAVLNILIRNIPYIKLKAKLTERVVVS